jgi:GNAT superfamily N-acetyltransferase
MTPDIVVPENPDPAIRNALLDFLIAYNESKTGPSGLAPLAVVLKDPVTGRLLGGLWGRTVYDWLFVEFLIVPEDLRGQGLGTRLLQRAEEEAIARGCCGICLDSFDFQAP